MVLRPSVCAECAFLQKDGFCEKFGWAVFRWEINQPGDCAGYWPKNEDEAIVRGLAEEAVAEGKKANV